MSPTVVARALHTTMPRLYTDAETDAVRRQRDELHRGRELRVPGRPSFRDTPGIVQLVDFLNARFTPATDPDGELEDVRQVLAQTVQDLRAGRHPGGGLGMDLTVTLRLVRRAGGRYTVESLAASGGDPLQYYTWLLYAAVQTGDAARLRCCSRCGTWALDLRRYCSPACRAAATRELRRARQRRNYHSPAAARRTAAR